MDLQKDPEWTAVGVELVSLAIDTQGALAEAAAAQNIALPLLSDPESIVTKAYGVDRWAVVGGEPGHTFVLVDSRGIVRWVRDYGAQENGGYMYVAPRDLLAAVRENLPATEIGN